MDTPLVCVSIACPVLLFPMVPLVGQSSMVLQAHFHSRTNFASFNIAWSSFRGIGVQYTHRPIQACKHIYFVVIFPLSSSLRSILGNRTIDVVTHVKSCMCICACTHNNLCFYMSGLHSISDFIVTAM